ncbi:MAG: Unknown protein [uncultured Campylobacterales bacterium]|uniref:RDD domain-containing protein n=1 Tax=uncultured Campylobacterales bacterium TaxID=352960 RepID=A0A6S6TEI7_9BACT|nr:MAG: Unknown protein [uncultured Campylobacterales bacterium]
MIVLRLKAFLVDLFMIMMPIAYLIYFFVPEVAQEMFYKYYFPIFYGIVINIFIYIKGQTPGLKAYNLTIIFNKKPRILFILIRYIAFLFVFGYFMAFFRKDRRTFHDVISFSKVIVSR